MAKTRAELEEMLEELQGGMDDLLEEYQTDDGGFWDAFAGQADVIRDAASAEDAQFVDDRITCILGSAGLIPSENEGEPCDE